MYIFLQALLDPDSGALPTVNTIKDQENGFLAHPVIGAIFYIILFLFILAVAAFIIRYFMRRKYYRSDSLRRDIMLVTLPKERTQEEKEGQPESNIQEMIDQVEVWYANMGGMRAQRGLKAFFRGRQDFFSLEIVAHEGLISFYVVTPHYLQNYMEEQIHAQFPKANIEIVEDHNIFKPDSQVTATNLVFRKKFIFPIKTYRHIDTDPLSALTNTLSKLDNDEGAVIQFICRSAKGQWHNQGAKVARKMHEGKKLKEATGGSSRFFNVIREIYRIFVPKKEEQPQTPGLVQLSARDEEIAKSIEEKTSRAGFDVNVRLIVSSKTKQRANHILKGIIDSFNQYTLYEYGNGFTKKGSFKMNKLIEHYIYRTFDEKRKVILNTEEMASLFHFPLSITETPNIRWLEARKAPAPINIPKEGIILGKNVYRNVEKEIRMKVEDRRRHAYLIGMTGTGKSALMEEMAKQDIAKGRGVCLVDPHGDLVENVLRCVPKERADDVIIFDPSDTERPMGLNMLEAKDPAEADFAVQEMIAIFHKLFPPEMIGPMFEHNMRNVMLTLIADKEYPGTITDIPRMFSDKDFQEYKVKKVDDPIVRSFWEKEMAKTSDFHKSEMLGYLISKVGRFVENKMMRNIIGQSRSGFNFDKIMDESKILLVSLSKGKVGEVNSNLLGLIIVSKLQMAAMARAKMPEEERKDFYLYIDEFQNFITDSIATILSEARKYRLNLTMAHQYLGQLVEKGDTKIRDAVLGNVGSMISFRIGVDDAEIIAKQFSPTFSEYDVTNIPRFNAYVKLLIDNSASKPFNMATYPPQPGSREIAEKIKELSRQKFARPVSEVDSEILKRTKLGSEKPEEKSIKTDSDRK